MGLLRPRVGLPREEADQDCCHSPRARFTLLRELGAIFLLLSAAVFANFALLLVLLSQIPADHPEIRAAGVHLHLLSVGVLALSLAALLWGFWATARRVVAPLRSLRAATERLCRGDFAARAEGDRLPDELGEVARAFNSMAAELGAARGKLDLEKRFSETLLERLPAGVAVIDEHGRVAYANPAAAGLFGRALGPSERPPVEEFAPLPGILEHLSRALERHEAVPWVRAELRRPAERHARHLRFCAVPIWRAATAPERSLLLIEDESEEVRAALARAQWQDMLIHDFKSPLTAIYSSIRAIRAEPALPPLAAKLAEVVERGARKLAALAETYLDLLRMEAASLTLSPGPVELGACARAAIEDLAFTAHRRRMRVIDELPGGLVVQADAGVLRRMLVNLLDNAIKYSSEGGEVGVRARAGAGGEATVEVWDRGPGIPPEDLPHAFDRFYRAQTGRGRPGTGLGLAFCKLAADLHGWGISLRSEPGLGTIVSLAIRARAQAPAKGGLAG